MLLGSIIVGSIAVVKKPDLFKKNTIENSTQLLDLKTFTDLPPSTKVKTLPGDNCYKQNGI